MPWTTQSIRPAPYSIQPIKPPSESWWVTCSREAFAERVAEEARRMKASRFGQIQLGTSVSDVRADRRVGLPR